MSYVLGMALAVFVSAVGGFAGGCIYTKKKLNK